MDKNVDDVPPTSSASQEDNESVLSGSRTGTLDVQESPSQNSSGDNLLQLQSSYEEGLATTEGDPVTELRETDTRYMPQLCHPTDGEFRDGVDSVHQNSIPKSDSEHKRRFLSAKNYDDVVRLILEHIEWLQRELQEYEAENQIVQAQLKRTALPHVEKDWPSGACSLPGTSTVDVGEEMPRRVCSGLVGSVPLEELQSQMQTSLQAASWEDGTKHSGEPNKAKPYLGDCQVVPRPDVDIRWMLPPPVPGGEYDSCNPVGGYSYNTQLSGHAEPLSSNLTGGTSNFPSSGALDLSNDNSFRSDFALGAREPYLRLYGQVDSGLNTSVPGNQRLYSGITVSHLANGSLMGTAGPQLTLPVHGLQRYSGRSNGASTLSAITGNSSTSMLNRDFGTDSVESTDNSLLALEQRVEEACALVERVLREREEREQFGREIERKEREIREQRARKKREREVREQEEASRWPQQQEAITGRSQWLCEHYQRHCRVRFPCCSYFYSCHRCHNNSKACKNEEAKACHATHLKCSFCQHEQEIGEDSGKCRSCGAEMSAYFCSICKHFTSVDKNPYHCEKCGICRIHKDKSFHCQVCNVCLDKRLEGKHKCRPDSGHDECCICLEDAFSGCQILPCSHKVHRECAIAMIQNNIRTCPVCRHPLYSQTSE